MMWQERTGKGFVGRGRLRSSPLAHRLQRGRQKKNLKKKRGYMYTYSCFVLLYSRNQYTIVKQL